VLHRLLDFFHSKAVDPDVGGPFFIDDPAIIKLASEKISAPLFAVVIRVAAQSLKSARAWRIAVGLGKSLRQFADAASNELIPIVNDGYDEEQHRDDVVTELSQRTSAEPGRIGLPRSLAIGLSPVGQTQARRAKDQKRHPHSRSGIRGTFKTVRASASSIRMET
jgi:hypothetical protein